MKEKSNRARIRVIRLPLGVVKLDKMVGSSGRICGLVDGGVFAV